MGGAGQQMPAARLRSMVPPRPSKRLIDRLPGFELNDPYRMTAFPERSLAPLLSADFSRDRASRLHFTMQSSKGAGTILWS
jgi:hypothetical protein